MRNQTIEIGELTLPAKYITCDRCEGTGSHSNPAIDGNGITSDEMHELGEDFREDYLNGVYDVRCYRCGGERVLLVLDPEKCTDEQIEDAAKWYQEEADYQALCAAERKAGC